MATFIGGSVFKKKEDICFLWSFVTGLDIDLTKTGIGPLGKEWIGDGNLDQEDKKYKENDIFHIGLHFNPFLFSISIYC